MVGRPLLRLNGLLTVHLLAAALTQREPPHKTYDRDQHRAGVGDAGDVVHRGGMAAVERWLAKFGQPDKWSFCLRAARVPRIRSDHDETSSPDA